MSLTKEPEEDLWGQGDGPKLKVLQYFAESDEIYKIISNLKNVCDDLRASELSCERFTFILDNYQDQPHLIDHHIDNMIGQLLSVAKDASDLSALQHQAFKYIYIISKVRNFKIIVRYLPHEVDDLEPVLLLLSLQNPSDHETWESRYILLLWLSIICIIPFDLSKWDSGHDKPIMDRILNFAKTYLVVMDKSQDAAAYLIAKFITRPDVKNSRMPEFFDWSLSVLNSADKLSRSGLANLTGVLSALALIFKHGKREDLIPFVSRILSEILKCQFKDSHWTSLRKLNMKLIQRLGFIFLKSRIATWRYQRGSRSLPENLAQPSAGIHLLKQNLPLEPKDEEEDYDVSEEVEEIIEQLLLGLKDKDTVVRWSAAKGIGRVTGRLPKELANDVVGSLLDLFTLSESDGAWHGGCLALAELGRRGLILPERLNKVVPVVLRALSYDERKGSFSVGAHVRDAACYVCWSFARAYDPEEVKPYVNQIASALVIMTVYDREVNCRRAASAAFQENVGRQGTFPHGIDILTAADYFMVGGRTKTYLDISVFIAQFSEYTHPLINHLLSVSISHWDSAIRELAAKSFHNLTFRAPGYMANIVLPALIDASCSIDINKRHGAIMSVGEVVYALAMESWKNNRQIENILEGSVVNDLKEIIPKLQKLKLLKGIGGEFSRQAANLLIERLSQAKLSFHGDLIIDVWQELIDENLLHLESKVHTGALSALQALCMEYYKNQDGTVIQHYQDKIISRYVAALEVTGQTIQSGYISALRVLPKFLIIGKFDVIVNSLIKFCLLENTSVPDFIEGRREAIKDISRICLTVGVSPSGSPDSCVCATNFHHLMNCLLNSLKDYTTDSRGDVGAWVREAAMQGLYDLLLLVHPSNSELLSPDMIHNIMNNIIQQVVEKIDRTRFLAGELFSKLLHHSPEIPYIPEREHLLKIFERSICDAIMWNVPAETFPLFTQLLALPCYIYHVILGLTVSVGGLTESLVKHSCSALISYLKSSDQAAKLNFIVTLVKVFRDYQKIDRITIPMLTMLTRLMAAGCLDVLEQDDQLDLTMELLTLCKAEISKSGDPNKLMASIDVFCGLLQFPETVRKKSLCHLAVFLCHKYPRIRKEVSRQLYEALVTFDGVIPEENLDQVMTILSDTKWDDALEKIRPVRNQLCHLMDIPQPVSLTKANTDASKM